MKNRRECDDDDADDDDNEDCDDDDDDEDQDDDVDEDDADDDEDDDDGGVCNHAGACALAAVLLLLRLVQPCGGVCNHAGAPADPHAADGGDDGSGGHSAGDDTRAVCLLCLSCMKASLACVHPDYKCEVQQTMAARLVELRIQCQCYRNTQKTKKRTKLSL